MSISNIMNGRRSNEKFPEEEHEEEEKILYYSSKPCRALFISRIARARALHTCLELLLYISSSPIIFCKPSISSLLRAFSHMLFCISSISLLIYVSSFLLSCNITAQLYICKCKLYVISIFLLIS